MTDFLRRAELATEEHWRTGNQSQIDQAQVLALIAIAHELRDIAKSLELFTDDDVIEGLLSMRSKSA